MLIGREGTMLSNRGHCLYKTQSNNVIGSQSPSL
uniref:Uncharacterized protein n=1 Tax=Arundo donax TaxID=35708 RepID=A0A0A9ST56_ARUDO